MPLLPKPEDIIPIKDIPGTKETYLTAFSAYDLPSVEALGWYFHAAVGPTRTPPGIALSLLRH